jgi:hypothetical protein
MTDTKSVVTTDPDPTLNVIALSEAANRRQDDLRIAESRRLDELHGAESYRVNELLSVRAEYDEKLRQAEAKRIDAIRAVDVNAVAVASQRASDQATVLATQVAQSAEALRALVATTAATVAQSQQQLANTLSARLTTLEQAQYEGAGKSKFSDPMMAQLVTEMQRAREAGAGATGAKAGSSVVIAYVVSGIMAFGGLLAIAATIIRSVGHS